MPELPADNNGPDYIGTSIYVRVAAGQKELVIPHDVTALEAACLGMFLNEWSRQMVSYRFDAVDRLKHYGLERFLVEAG